MKIQWIHFKGKMLVKNLALKLYFIYNFILLWKVVGINLLYFIKFKIKLLFVV